jgi:hypothetical protein
MILSKVLSGNYVNDLPTNCFEIGDVDKCFVGSSDLIEGTLSSVLVGDLNSTQERFAVIHMEDFGVGLKFDQAQTLEVFKNTTKLQFSSIQDAAKFLAQSLNIVDNHTQFYIRSINISQCNTLIPYELRT